MATMIRPDGADLQNGRKRVDVLAGADMTDGEHSRDAERDSMFLQASLRPATGGNPPAFNVRVRNLSAGGLMAEAEVAVAAGDPITVELRNVGRVDGHVAWVRGKRFGVTFDTIIDPKLARGANKSESIQPVMTSTGYRRITHPLG